MKKSSYNLSGILKKYVEAMEAKNLEFVTRENGFVYHVGYKTIEDGARVHFITREKEIDGTETVFHPITESEYKKICKGKLFAVDFFKG